MTTTTDRGRGRPRAISREMLRESAFELFLEHGYAATTVSEIARVAGVSRNTFFNYFTGKADVFWTELDDARDRVRASLSDAPALREPLAAVRDALLDAGDTLGPGQVPFALTQHALIGAQGELQSSALASLAALTAEIQSFLAAREVAPAVAGPAAYAVVAAAVASTRTWASAGTGRGSLRPYLDAAISPVCAAFA